MTKEGKNAPPAIEPGLVSVVLVNYRGAEDTVTCLRSFGGIDWPADRLELIVVDNASGDGSVERIRAEVAHAQVVCSEVNRGFAGGCNLGAAHARGEYLAFINNDARPGAEWIKAAVEVLRAQADVGCVASKVLDWEGERIDFVDGSLTWYGMGYKRECEQPDTGEWDTPKDVLFATGAAMFVRADVYRAVDGFDDRYFMFYEDVDLGWRLNLLGWRVRYVPRSLAYHRHHASMKSYGPWREHFLLERNALMSLYKNLGEAKLAKALPAALLLATRRGISRGDADNLALDLAGRPPSGPEPETVEVSRETLSATFAMDSFLDHLPTLAEDRRRLQAERRRSDTELLPLFRQALEPAYAHPRYEAAHRVLVEVFGIDEAFSTRRKIVIATQETLSARMAGPAIRAWAMAEALSLEHDVELVTTGTCTISHPRFTCRSVGLADMRGLERWCDILVFQGLILSMFRWLVGSDKILIADIYNPFHLEQLEQAKDQGAEGRARTVSDCTTALNDQLTRGDFFLCASEKQRDFWLGQLSAVGRLNPKNYDADETMEKLIAVAPFGVPDDPPVHTRDALKGVVPGIGVDDKVILWGGGIYNWFDPLTLLHAVDRLRHRRPEVRLFFLGLKHPNPDVPEMRMAVATRALSDALGLTDKHVFFNEGWVPLRGPPELPARGRHRRQHPPRPRRDGLLVPHPHPRLPVGRPADRRHGRRHVRRPHRGEGAGPHRSPRRRRGARGRTVPPARRRGVPRRLQGPAGRDRPEPCVEPGARPVGGVLPGPEAGCRPGRTCGHGRRHRAGRGRHPPCPPAQGRAAGPGVPQGRRAGGGRQAGHQAAAPLRRGDWSPARRMSAGT